MLNGRKVILVCPAYVPVKLFRETRRRMAGLDTPGIIDERWMLLLKYPLPTVESNEAGLVAAAKEFGYHTFDVPVNLGESANVNGFLAAYPQPPGTIYIKFDGDAWTQDAGWDKAIVETICDDPFVAVCSLGIPELHSLKQIRPERVQNTHGYRAFYHPSMMRYDIAGTDLDFVKQIGGFRTPGTMWGGLEGCMHEELQKYGRGLVYLLDHVEGPTDGLDEWKDTAYGEWKWENYHHRFPGSFDDYLRVAKSG
jgi:hypothetical protein